MQSRLCKQLPYGQSWVFSCYFPVVCLLFYIYFKTNIKNVFIFFDTFHIHVPNYLFCVPYCNVMLLCVILLCLYFIEITIFMHKYLSIKSRED